MTTFSEIKNRLNIRDVLAGHIEVNHHGFGYCPFHGPEKTPSLKIYEDENRFHCFGCGAHGDAFDFVEKLYDVSRTEALRILAAKAGISLNGTRPSPEVSREIRENQERRRRREMFDLWKEKTWRDQANTYRVLNRLCRMPLPKGWNEEAWLDVLAPLYHEITRAEAVLEVFEAGNLQEHFFLFQEMTQHETHSRGL